MSLRKQRNEGTNLGNSNPAKGIKSVKRVEDIILSTTHPEYGGPHTLGTIFFTDEKAGETSSDPSRLPRAIPISKNMHTYPLIGELVEVTTGPSPDYYPSLGGTKTTQINFYYPSLNIYNSSGNNALPNNENNDNYKPGTYFEENEFQKSLIPSEGDTIIEGKKGQRIRFTSVGSNGVNVVSQDATKETNDGNPTIGSPAIVISLGSGGTENVTNDAASIYILSDQKIPIDTSAVNVDSLKSEYTPVKTPIEELEDIPPTPPPSTTTVEEDLSSPEISFESSESQDENEIPKPIEDVESDSDPVFDALDEAQDEGNLLFELASFDISEGEEVSEENTGETDFVFPPLEGDLLTDNSPDINDAPEGNIIYINTNYPLGNSGLKLGNLVASDTAADNNITNFPGVDAVQGTEYSAKNVTKNLDNLCVNCLDALRAQFSNLRITSGFRGNELNNAVGGSETSEHVLGRAVDLKVPNVPTYVIFNYIVSNNIPYNQLIWEFPEREDRSWIHISFFANNNKFNRTIASKSVKLKAALEKAYPSQINFGGGTYARSIKISTVPDHKTLIT